MNKSELKAITIIANKMNWQNKPVECVIETIKQMVRNQQALELDCYGDCDGDEETLLSIALWDTDKILSTMYVSDYISMINWSWDLFCEDMGMSSDDANAMMEFYVLSQNYLAECYEAEEEEQYYDEMYECAMREEMNWYNHARQMGWE